MATRERIQVDIGDLPRHEYPAAVEVLARGMRDNPIHVAALGDDPDARVRCLRVMFTGLFRTMTAQQPICARRDGEIVGVTGVAPPGACMPTVAMRLRFLPGFVRLGPRRALRVTRWIDAWAKRDVDETHFHLGPVAVDTPLQGHGIGSQIMAAHTGRLDAEGVAGYLETDKPQNVAFYERHGYEVLAEAPVLDVPNWFMLRRPR